MQTTLASGQLKQKMGYGKCRMKTYRMTFLDHTHLSSMMALQEFIVQNLSRPDLLQTFSYDFMKQHLGRRGMVLGILVEDRLVAFRNVYYPSQRDKEWNLGIDLDLPAAELAHVANLQMVCVHPDFRGNALAHKMNRVSLDRLRDAGTYHHICATVSPHNVWNLPILFRSGFRIVNLKNKYGGKQRYVVYQNLRQPMRFSDDSAVYVRLDDLGTQKMQLSRGLCAIAQKETGDRSSDNPSGNFHLIFKSPLRRQAFTENPNGAETEEPKRQGARN